MDNPTDTTMSPAETLLAEPLDSVTAPELAPVALDTNTPTLVVELAPLDTCIVAPGVEELVPPDTLMSPPTDPEPPDTDKDPPVPTDPELAPPEKVTFPPDRPPEPPDTLTTPPEAVLDAPGEILLETRTTPLSTAPVTAL